MSKASLRDRMPVIATVVDDLRDIFGKDVIDARIRLAMQGQPTFWITEAGHEFGVRDPAVDVPIVAGRGIFYSVVMPEGAAVEEWMKKAYMAMDRIAARLKAAEQQNATQGESNAG